MEQTQPKKQYHVHYGPAGGRTRVDFDELWRYKDLIWLFVKRDFTVLYKQTVLGPAWILINPLLRAVMIANPMTAPMESFRAVCFNSGEVSVLMWVISLAWTVVLLGVGISLFGKVEKTFVDTV